jgi:hypothetical protein
MFHKRRLAPFVLAFSSVSLGADRAARIAPAKPDSPLRNEGAKK